MGLTVYNSRTAHQNWPRGISSKISCVDESLQRSQVCIRDSLGTLPASKDF